MCFSKNFQLVVSLTTKYDENEVFSWWDETPGRLKIVLLQNKSNKKGNKRDQDHISLTHHHMV